MILSVYITMYVLCSNINCYCVQLFCDISENYIFIHFQGHVNSCTTVQKGHSMRSAGKWCILRMRITRMDTEMHVKASFINIHSTELSAVLVELMCTISRIRCLICCVAITRIYALGMNFVIHWFIVHLTILPLYQSISLGIFR